MIIRKYFFLLGIEFNNESKVIACLYLSGCNEFLLKTRYQKPLDMLNGELNSIWGRWPTVGLELFKDTNAVWKFHSKNDFLRNFFWPYINSILVLAAS